MLFLLLFIATLFETLPGWNESEAIFTPIGGGITNKNMLLRVGGNRYFVRFGGETRELLGASSQAEREGLLLGFSPKLIADDPESGLLILEYIDSEKVSLRDPFTLKKCTELLKALHECGAPFSRTLLPEEMIAHYLSQLPPSERALAILSQLPPLTYEKLSPCHLDLHHQNILKQGERLYFIDWEYAALSEPLFDLATLASCEHFSDREMLELLSLYSPEFNEESERRLYTLRILADLRWALWSLIQASESKIDYPFEKLAESFFKEAENRLNLSL